MILFPVQGQIDNIDLQRLHHSKAGPGLDTHQGRHSAVAYREGAAAYREGAAHGGEEPAHHREEPAS